MSEPEPDDGVREWIGGRGEELLGKLAQELLDVPALSAAVGRAFEARGKATQAQAAAIGWLGIPSASDVERLTRRVRAVSQRLDTIEDALRRIEDGLRDQAAPLADRLEAIEEQVAAATRQLSELQAARVEMPAPVARDQQRQRVQEVLLATKTSKASKGKRRKGDA
jgi:predicted  nucleic acid-binding Zn-ribbon protein